MNNTFKYFKIILGAIAFLVLFSTCKKYPENGRIYLSTVKHRFESHDWFFKNLFVNGIDSTSEYAKKFDQQGTLSSIQLDLDIKSEKLIVNYPMSISGYIEYGIVISDKKRKMQFFEKSYERNFFVDNDIVWNIRKLTKKDLIIEGNNDNNNYRFEFKK